MRNDGLLNGQAWSSAVVSGVELYGTLRHDGFLSGSDRFGSARRGTVRKATDRLGPVGVEYGSAG